MNKTQIFWSKTLKCCSDRESSEVEFISLSCISIFVSILFYIGTYIFTLRKERIQYIPDDLMPPEHSGGQSSEAIMNINVPNPSISDSPRTNRTSLTKITNISDDSSSDDEPLSIQKDAPSNNIQPNLLEF